LLPFLEQDANLFFGRDRFLFGDEQSKAGLVKAVQTQPLVAVIGPSGSGKSSVVFAGLIPQLRVEGNWLIDTFRPQNQPFYGLASALVRLLKPELDEIQQMRRSAELKTDLVQGKLTLLQVTSNILERNLGKRLLLVVDQFEEIYTLCPDEEQYQFTDILLDAINQDNLTLVLTLRADFYGYVLSNRRLRDALQRFTPQLLSSMNREELKFVIEKPLERLNISLESELTQRILDDVGREPGNLPLLEFALSRLWKKKQNRKLTHSAYNEIGGVRKAVANHAADIYSQLSEAQQKQAQHIFVQLVHPGEGTEDTRRLATQAEVGDENWSLVTYLASYKARLVVTGWNAIINENTIEVVHEALIREWKDLQDWVAADRKFRTWQESLRSSIHTWENSGLDKDALLRGLLLVEAEDWLEKRFNKMSLSEKKFIQKSQNQRNVAENKAKFTRYGFATLGIILVTLGLFAQRQFSALQSQENLTTALITGGSSLTSELMYDILPRELQIANQKVNNNRIDEAIAFYKATLTSAQNFIDAASRKESKFKEKDTQAINSFRDTAESSLAQIIKAHYLPELEAELNTHKTDREFGKLKENLPITDFENQYTEGPLKTTYRILMRKPGLEADLNKNGLLDATEAIYLPCETLKEIELMWRRITDWRCGFYDQTNKSKVNPEGKYYAAESCTELSHMTLTERIFPRPIAAAVDRIKSCKVEELIHEDN
jgi:hypothetical protein